MAALGTHLFRLTMLAQGYFVLLLPLTSLILALNAAVDAGEKATLDEAKRHIRDGDVLVWLKARFKLDIGPAADPDRIDGKNIVRGLQELRGGYDGSERRKWGIENNGLCLLIAWVNELAQEEVLHEAG